MRPSIVLRPPAKLNLTLEVLKRRDDGYHALRSVMVPVDLCDQLTIESSESPVTLECDRSELADDNLVMRAWRALSLPERGFRITLHKRIPTQAGLGGGSSDAAAILSAAQSGAFGDPPARDYVAIARSLGSDVPFFLVGTGALVEGTGERVTAVGALPPWHAVIVKPPVAVSTADAYRAIDEHPRPSRPRSESVSIEIVDALQTANFARVQSLLSNDFHDLLAGTTPQIGNAVDALRAAGAQSPMLAGSGSSVFVLTETAEQAADVLSRLQLDDSYLRFTCALATSEQWRAEARA